MSICLDCVIIIASAFFLRADDRRNENERPRAMVTTTYDPDKVEHNIHREVVDRDEYSEGTVSIRERREELGLTQWELAQLVGVSGPIVSMWERNLYGPSDRYRQALADALQVPLHDLRLRAPKKAGRPPIYTY